MLSSLLTTKLYIPPARAALIPRPRLLERLSQGIQGPLTLLSAPPGSGKTCLLSEWRATEGAAFPLAWLSLDAADNDPNRFFHHLVASLDLLSPGLLPALTPLLESPDLSGPAILFTPLINCLNEFPGDFLLILDDYHLIENKLIHNSLLFLLDHLPPRMHLVLLTRADPPLPLARLRARGQLTEIRAEHLRFSLEEATRFLNQVMGLALTTEQVAALEKRTEGWVAGLQLAALSMQGRADVEGFISAFTGSNHYIVDYLAEEVLERQPEAMRAFLLQTSILERLSGPLCDALTGIEDSAAILQSLDHANLFIIPLDKDQVWYRYHALFADLLRSRLLHSNPSELTSLHHRASSWFEANGFLDEALEHALSAGDFPHAADLFCRNSLEVIYTRSMTTLEHWLTAFPPDFLLQDPRLCIAQGHVLWAEGRRDALEPYIQGAESSLSAWLESGRLPDSDPQAVILRGEILIFRSFFFTRRHEMEAACESACKALENLPAGARSRAYALGSLYMIYQTTGEIDLAVQAASEAVTIARQLDYPSMHATAAYSCAQLLRAQGKLSASKALLLESVEFAARKGRSRLFYNGILHIGLAETYYSLNLLAEMEAELQTGLEICHQGGMNILVTFGLFGQMSLYHARGELDRALAAVDEVERLCAGMDPTLYREDCRISRIMLGVEKGLFAPAEAYLASLDLTVGQKLGNARYYTLYNAAYLLYQIGRHAETLQILEEMEKIERRDGQEGWLTDIYCLQALNHQKQKDSASALQALAAALELAQKENNQRAFLDYREPMRELLTLAHRQGISPAFIERLLSAFESEGTSTENTPAPRGLLSKRELELLALVADGCSNKEIASRLVLSLGTVKRHTVNIFNKLDVKNRTEAVARARELKLL